MADAPDPMAHAIGLRLRALREERNLTQWAVARAVGIERGSIANLEAGTHRVGLRTLMVLASYFGVSLDYLVHGHVASDDAMPPRSKLAILWGWLTSVQRDQMLEQISDLVRGNADATQRSDAAQPAGRPIATRIRSRSARGSRVRPS
jgi:transcriptional regulator with XRE-family HTH domain